MPATFGQHHLSEVSLFDLTLFEIKAPYIVLRTTSKTMTAKRVLAPPGLAVSQVHLLGKNKIRPHVFEHSHFKRLLDQAGVFVVLFALFALSAFHCKTLEPFNRNYSDSPLYLKILPLSRPKAQYESCSSIVATTTRTFGYNVTDERSIAQNWHFVDSSSSRAAQRLKGRVIVDRGDSSQSSDIEVVVVVSSTFEEDLGNVIINSSTAALSLEYSGSASCSTCTEIQAFVRLRPRPRRVLDVLEIRCNILDIWIKGDLAWEINNLILHTSHGDSTFEGTRWADPLVTHNVSSSSITGEIFGYYTANGHLEIHGPFDPKSVSVSSGSGDIHVQAGFEYWDPHSLTHVTNIHTKSGPIWVYIPHGSSTNVSTVSGSIATYFKPYGAASLDDLSEIHTSSQSGNTRVYLTDMDMDAPKQYHSPLLNTTSTHIVGSGRIELYYPYSWYGHVEAKIKHGPLSFDSSSLAHQERGEGWVKARRGDVGDSQLDVRVDEGEIEMPLGLC
ncbi:hypothetical protein EK21DRAFT_114255 [Setomelanomma holmii]|uniref:Adhesin domain-containing protein n=1 Tax=Setomelanomma holmii TaxID=210430 RepID=A0A9P4LKW4_9PLEO|nr:hypothetical protein EK21DRAFT_114255 [Setomelanomma holmii]